MTTEMPARHGGRRRQGCAVAMRRPTRRQAQGKEKRRQTKALAYAKAGRPRPIFLVASRPQPVPGERVLAEKIGGAQTRYRRRSAAGRSSAVQPAATSACSANIAVQALYWPGRSDGENGMPSFGSTHATSALHHRRGTLPLCSSGRQKRRGANRLRNDVQRASSRRRATPAMCPAASQLRMTSLSWPTMAGRARATAG